VGWRKRGGPAGGQFAAPFTALKPFDDSNDPIALYDFSQEHTNDLSGFDHHLTAEVGTAHFSEFVSGQFGLWLDGSTVLASVNPAPATLITEGDVTLLFAFRFEHKLEVSPGDTLLSLGNNGVNQAYSMSVGTSYIFSVNHENGASVDNIIDFTSGSRRHPLAGQPIWTGAVRDASAKTWTCYMGGREFAAPQTYANNPDNTSAGRLRIGSSVTPTLLRVQSTVFYSVKIVAAAYTAEQMATEWNNTFGGTFGLVEL